MEHDLNLHVKTTIQMVSAELGRFPWRRLLFLPEWVYAQRLWKYNGEKNSLEFLMKMLFQYTDKPEFPSNSKMYCCWDSERDSFSENWVVDFTVGCFSEDLFNFLRRCGFLSESGLKGRRERFQFRLQYHRALSFYIERTDLLFNQVMHALGVWRILERQELFSKRLEQRSCLKFLSPSPMWDGA